MTREGCSDSPLTCRERQAVINDVHTAKGQKLQKELKRKRTMKRIKEYEKFESNCRRVLEKDEARRRGRSRERRRNTLMETRQPRVHVLRKAKSVGSNGSDRGRSESRQIGSEMTLAGRLYLVSLVRLWRARATGSQRRASSMPAPTLQREEGLRRRGSAPAVTILPC